MSFKNLKSLKIAVFSFLTIIICYGKIRACQDPTVKELGWVFKLDHGGFQLFSFKNNDAIGITELRSVKTNSKGDTISVSFNNSLYFPFSYNVVMDRLSDGSYFIAGVQDSQNVLLIKQIYLDSNSNISRRTEILVPTDSIQNNPNITLRNIHGLGFLIFGTSNHNYTYYKTEFIDFNGNVSYLAENYNSSSFTRVGDAVSYNNHILMAGDGTALNFEGQELRISDLKGKTLKWALYTNISNMFSTSTQITQIIPLPDSNIVISGYYSIDGNANKFFIAKLDSNLDTLWTRILDLKFFDPSRQMLFLDILGMSPTANGGFGLLLKSFRNNNFNNADVIARFDKNGNMIWIKDLGPYQCLVYNFIESSTNNFAMSVTSMANIGNDLYLLNFNTTDTLINQGRKNTDQLINLYPNPASSYLNISFSGNSTGNIVLYNAQGEKVKQYINITQSNLDIPIENLANGLYIVCYTDVDGNKFNNKFIKK